MVMFPGQTVGIDPATAAFIRRINSGGIPRPSILPAGAESITPTILANLQSFLAALHSPALHSPTLHSPTLHSPAAPAAVPLPQGNSGGVDPAAVLDNLASSLFKGGNYDLQTSPEYQDWVKQSQILGNAPSQSDLQGMLAGVQATAAAKELAAIHGIPVPQHQMYSQMDLPPLTLPTAPHEQAPHMNPLSSILAGIAGMVAPQAAGQFGAAALGGDVTAAQDENRRRQMDYENAFRGAVLEHQDIIARAEAANQIEQANKDLVYRNSVDQTKRQMTEAQLTANEANLTGEAGVYAKYGALSRPAAIAAEQIPLDKQIIDAKSAAAALSGKEGIAALIAAAKLRGGMFAQEQSNRRTNLRLTAMLQMADNSQTGQLLRALLGNDSRGSIAAANRKGAYNRAALSSATRITAAGILAGRSANNAMNSAKPISPEGQIAWKNWQASIHQYVVLNEAANKLAAANTTQSLGSPGHTAVVNAQAAATSAAEYAAGLGRIYQQIENADIARRRSVQHTQVAEPTIVGRNARGNPVWGVHMPPGIKIATHKTTTKKVSSVNIKSYFNPATNQIQGTKP